MPLLDPTQKTVTDPPPPPGYILDGPGSADPPPPAGYTLDSPGGSSTPKPPSMGQQALGAAKGVAKGFLERGPASTASSIDDYVAKIPGVGKWLTTPLVGNTTSQQARQDLHAASVPQNMAEKVGKFGEQAAEFMVPGGAEEKSVAKLTSLAPKAAEFIRPAAKIGAAALSSGTVNKAQGGNFGSGVAMGAGGAALGQGLHALAPKIAESAINITKGDRAFGRNPGRALLDETKGYRPETVASSAEERLGQLNPQLDAAADAASVRARPHIAGLLPAPAQEIPLHSAPDIAGTPSKPITLNQPDRPMPKLLEGPKRTLPSSSHSDIFPDQLPHGTTNIPTQLPSEASGMNASQYIGQIPGERGGPGQVQGVLLRHPEPPASLSPIPTTEPNASASLAPARSIVNSAANRAAQQNAEGLHSQLGGMQDFLHTRFASGEPIPNDVTPRQLLDLKRGLSKEYLGNWNPEVHKDIPAIGRQAYHALDSELDRTVPEAGGLNQRISSLIPVAQRAESVGRNASTAQKTIGRLSAHTGAATLGGIGGYEGYRQGGVGGAILGGLGGIVAPELLSSPEGQITAARLLNKADTLKPLTGAILNTPRYGK